jgi:preflagellin peptidase FlaK
VVTGPDLLRLLAVPAFAWASYRDLAVRRVPNRLWVALAAVGVLATGWEAVALGVFTGPYTVLERLFVLRVVLSVGVLVPFAYLVWWVGGFGGADAKALMTLAVLLPTYPTYEVAGVLFPAGPAALGVFSLSVLTNTVLVAALYPLGLVAANLADGAVSPLMAVGRKVPAASVPDRHGRLLETPDGTTRSGLDVDALRMYLRWRDCTLADVRADPDRFRNPATLPDDPGDPGDGAIADGGERTRPADEDPAAGPAGPGDAHDDPWGAAAFLDDVEHAWGADAATLRDGLEVLATRERVWYSPGIPFVVPMFGGLLLAFLYGDVLFAAMGALGLLA